MAIRGHASERLRIPEQRCDGHSRIGEHVGAVAPDEEGIARLPVAAKPVAHGPAVAIEDGVRPILLLTGRQQDIARAEARNRHNEREARGQHNGPPSRTGRRCPHETARGGDRQGRQELQEVAM